MNNLTVVDTPGFGDPNLSTRTWIQGAQNVQGYEFDALIYVINSTSRVSLEMIVYTIVSRYLLRQYSH